MSTDPVEIARYDPVARALHWLIAALVVAVVSLGWAMPESPRGGDSRDLLLILHRSIGLLVLALMSCRLLWRAGHPPPPLPAGFPRVEALGAHANHALLYVVFLAMPLSGYLNAAAAGHAVSFFGFFAIPPLLAENDRLSQAAIAVHLAGQFAVYALVGAHAAAALLHAVQGRHRILDRMLPPRRRS